MTVYKNMAFSLKLRGVARKEIDERVRQTAKILGIEPLLARKPKALSGGERQRVAVGRAIVRQPAAFLFDEPLSNLDARLRLEMRAELKNLHQRLRRTVLYVTHDQEEAMTLGDRIVVMQAGRIQQAGKPLDVYGRPANRFVASFVGTPPMNFFDGRLVRQDGICFDNSAFRLRLPEEPSGRLANWLERPVVLGVRPEAMSIEAAGRFAGPGNAIGARVLVVEPLGEKMDLFVNAGGDRRAVARIDARENLHVGDELNLYVDTRRLYIFEPGPDGNSLLTA
jgi:multiple sugar transport system ATP-binding protein